MCTKKFLGLLSPRTGSIVLAYVGIAISVMILIFYLLVVRASSVEYSEAVLTGDYGTEYGPDEDRLSKEDEKAIFRMIYYYILNQVICYFFVYMTFIIFSVFLAIGAHHKKSCLVRSYFIYGFIHCFFCLVLTALHFFIDQYVQASIMIVSDAVFVFCLCGVKGLINSINSGQVYARYKDETIAKMEQQTKPNFPADKFNKIVQAI